MVSSVRSDQGLAHVSSISFSNSHPLLTDCPSREFSCELSNQISCWTVSYKHRRWEVVSTCEKSAYDIAAVPSSWTLYHTTNICTTPQVCGSSYVWADQHCARIVSHRHDMWRVWQSEISKCVRIMFLNLWNVCYTHCNWMVFLQYEFSRDISEKSCIWMVYCKHYINSMAFQHGDFECESSDEISGGIVFYKWNNWMVSPHCGFVDAISIRYLYWMFCYKCRMCIASSNDLYYVLANNGLTYSNGRQTSSHT